MPKFTHTIANNRRIHLPEEWRYFYCESCLSGATQATIEGIAEQQTFDIRKTTRFKSEKRDGLYLRNTTGSTITVSGFYGLDEYGSGDSSGDAIEISSLPAVELAANLSLSVNTDTAIATGTTEDFAAPVGAKGAIISLVTSGTTFGEVRVSGTATYAAGKGVPLPVEGAGYYLDTSADLSVHNANAGSVDVNVTWIS